MSLLTRKTALLVKKETTYGVDVQPTTSDLLEITDFDITPEIDVVERNYFRPSLSPVGSIAGKRYTSLSFTVELKGAGTDNNGLAVQPKVAEVLEACGFSLSTQTYDDDGDGTTDRVEYVLKPTSDNIASLTFYAYLDGLLYKVVGARGNVQISVEANQIGKMQFNFTGLYIKPEDAIFPNVPCESAIAPPLIKNVNLTMGGYAPILSSFEVNMNNDLTQRDDMNSAEGVREVIITGRRPEVTLNPDLMLVSEYDVWQKFENGEPQSIQAQFGSEIGNKIRIEMPEVVISKVGLGDRDGVRIANITGIAQGCDDEVQIIFG